MFFPSSITSHIYASDFQSQRQEVNWPEKTQKSLQISVCELHKALNTYCKSDIILVIIIITIT
jgi:hypothetical protein